MSRSEETVSFSQHHEFLNPLCLPGTVDIFTPRRAILTALQDHLSHFQGKVLDIGCGNKPYRPLLFSPPSRVENYVGLDVRNGIYQQPDVEWNGRTMPFDDNSFDCALATEVFEHCPDPELVMKEAVRVLKPGGFLFFTVPFIWVLHEIPHDEYRYTPFSLERHLRNAGFGQIQLKALGGMDASLAQVLGLWIGYRPIAYWKRWILSRLVVPVVRFLLAHDQLPQRFDNSVMITGLSGTAVKPAR